MSDSAVLDRKNSKPRTKWDQHPLLADPPEYRPRVDKTKPSDALEIELDPETREGLKRLYLDLFREEC